MHITLIGMSNIGKSYWSKRLEAEAGFRRIDCDTLIEKWLGQELSELGYQGIHDVARWMGQPYEARYAQASKRYVEVERAVMLDAIATLRKADPHEPPYVIDTTGSVIYAGDDVAHELKSLTQVVYIAASSQHVSQLFADYLARPKPVIWSDTYACARGETLEDALERCYPQLLSSRARLYERMADVIIPSDRHRDPKATAHDLFDLGDTPLRQSASAR
ncbi:MAG: hypothetical protein ABTQ34_07370 [Bdellovibrionales bacterium]